VKYRIGDECVGCGTCFGECPVNAIVEKDDKYEILPDKCDDCGMCVEVCPVEAITQT
jgi:ferredoxin